jgi:hypothetical protein
MKPKRFCASAKIERTTAGKGEDGRPPCVKQRVVITDDDAGKNPRPPSGRLRSCAAFPVCVATKENEGTVVIRFRKDSIQGGGSGPVRAAGGIRRIRRHADIDGSAGGEIHEGKRHCGEDSRSKANLPAKALPNPPRPKARRRSRQEEVVSRTGSVFGSAGS